MLLKIFALLYAWPPRTTINLENVTPKPLAVRERTNFVLSLRPNHQFSYMAGKKNPPTLHLKELAYSPPRAGARASLLTKINTRSIEKFSESIEPSKRVNRSNIWAYSMNTHTSHERLLDTFQEGLRRYNLAFL